MINKNIQNENEIEMCCDNPECIAEHLRNKMKNTKKEIEEPEDFDMGDNFQMEIYNYGLDSGFKAGQEQLLDKFEKKIDSCVIKHIFQGKNEFLLIDKEELKQKLEGLKN